MPLRYEQEQRISATACPAGFERRAAPTQVVDVISVDSELDMLEENITGSHKCLHALSLTAEHVLLS